MATKKDSPKAKAPTQVAKATSKSTPTPSRPTSRISEGKFGQANSTQKAVGRLDNQLTKNNGVFDINKKTFQNLVNDLGSAERARRVVSKYGAGLPGTTTTETGEGDDKQTVTNTPYKLGIKQGVIDKYNDGGFKADLSKQKGLSRQLRILGNDGVFTGKEYDKLLEARGDVGSDFNQRLLNRLGEEGISIGNGLAKRFENGKMSTGATNGGWDLFNQMSYTDPRLAGNKNLTQLGNSEFTNRFLDEAYNGKGAKDRVFNGADWQTKDSVRAGAQAAGDWSPTRDPWTGANVTKPLTNTVTDNIVTDNPVTDNPVTANPVTDNPTNPDSMNQGGLGDDVPNWATTWRGARGIKRATQSKNNKVNPSKAYTGLSGITI